MRIIETPFYKINEETQEQFLLYTIIEKYNDITEVIDGEEVVISELVEKKKLMPNGNYYIVNVKNQNINQFFDISISLDVLKEDKRSEINIACTKAIEEGFTFEDNPYTFKSIPDQDNITQLDRLFDKDPTLVTGWRAANDETITMDKTKFDAFVIAAQTHKMAQLNKAWTLKDQLKLATTKEDIELIVW